MLTSTVNYIECQGQTFSVLLTNGWIIRRMPCRGQACILRAECCTSQCLNAEPFTWGPQCLPCAESSNVLLDEVLTTGSGHHWAE